MVKFRGKELQKYFTKLSEEKIVARIKPQDVFALQKVYAGTVRGAMKSDPTNILPFLIRELGMRLICTQLIACLWGPTRVMFAWLRDGKLPGLKHRHTLRW